MAWDGATHRGLLVAKPATWFPSIHQQTDAQTSGSLRAYHVSGRERRTLRQHRLGLDLHPVAAAHQGPTCSSVLAERTSPKKRPCARETGSQSFTSVRYTRVRTTSFSVPPRARRLAEILSMGAYVVRGLWAVSGGLLRGVVPQAEQARTAALQVGLIGVLIALMLLWRPRGLMGEAPAVSRHASHSGT